MDENNVPMEGEEETSEPTEEAPEEGGEEPSM